VPKSGSTQTVVGLSQSSTVASNSVPIVGAEEGGEKGSTCAVAFTGHTVGSIFPYFFACTHADSLTLGLCVDSGCVA
jgi:hypothetical protein